ncbi:MAG TPA: SNF2-related protein [Anaeromyxobacteraceae bacterium]|nr:SNF2-related protein [Anaeromyxobacteraceae bacterium]
MKWEPGMKVAHRAQREWGVGVIIQVADDGRRLAVRFAGRDGITVVSGRDPAVQALHPDTPIEAVAPSGALEGLASPGPVAAFALRARIARLEAMRRADSLGALLSSRVHVLPHQVGAAGRILQDRIPRFVLADEVGLGKTIEAGLVFAGLRQLGVVDRAVVAVPEHLAFQWLAELFHKFNALFTLLSPERVAALGGPREALARSPLSIVSFEHLLASPDLARAAAEIAPDLLVVDEAHHLEEDALHDVVAPLARASFGLLLLTATPVRLDPREYFRLLALVEPVPTTSLDEFLRRLEQHEAYAEVARGLLAGGDPLEARRRLSELAPDDPLFGDGPADAGALLAHLADRYSLSSRLIRNRRVTVGAFTRRVLRREDAAAGDRIGAAAETCARLARSGEKVLAFGGDLEVLRATQTALARLGLEGLLYDDATTIEARDRLVARFRDPDGPMVLLSGESGGEGRNFQFASHLVCVDLPESPLALEQRIGRLDRLGQHRPVEIHVIAEPGDAFLLDLYDQVIGIFDEPVGGLDAVLASVPAELAALRAQPADASSTFRESLAARVAEGRRAQREGYDPLLDIRSASLPELTALVRNAFSRLGEEIPTSIAGGSTPTAAALADGLLTVSRWLEEELEDVCADVGRRVGIEVDTDENVHPFEVAFTLGAHLRIDALPGMAIPEEPTTYLGSFWRETAVARDELHWFATGHPLVEALVGLVRDGAAGRATAARVEGAPRRGALLLRFHTQWPAPADLAPGARVPSRQAARYLEASPISVAVDLATARVAPGLAEKVEPALEDAADVRVGAPAADVLEAARRSALGHARGVLDGRRKEALSRLEAHAEQEEERLVAAAFAGGASRDAVDAALHALRAHRTATEEALRAVDLELDAAAIVVP